MTATRPSSAIILAAGLTSLTKWWWNNSHLSVCTLACSCSLPQCIQARYIPQGEDGLLPHLAKQQKQGAHLESSRCITAWPTRATEATCSPEMFSHCVRSCRKCLSRAGTCPPAISAGARSALSLLNKPSTLLRHS